jgi:hypothetical protein
MAGRPPDGGRNGDDHQEATGHGARRKSPATAVAPAWIGGDAHGRQQQGKSQKHRVLS